MLIVAASDKSGPKSIVICSAQTPVTIPPIPSPVMTAVPFANVTGMPKETRRFDQWKRLGVCEFGRLISGFAGTEVKRRACLLNLLSVTGRKITRKTASLQFRFEP